MHTRQLCIRLAAGRRHASLSTLAVAAMLLAGCSTTVQKDPIFEVVPPAQQTSICRSDSDPCVPSTVGQPPEDRY